MSMHHVQVSRAEVEVLITLEKEGGKPNGLQYDIPNDRLLVADQAGAVNARGVGGLDPSHAASWSA